MINLHKGSLTASVLALTALSVVASAPVSAETSLKQKAEAVTKAVISGYSGGGGHPRTPRVGGWKPLPTSGIGVGCRAIGSCAQRMNF